MMVMAAVNSILPALLLHHCQVIVSSVKVQQVPVPLSPATTALAYKRFIGIHYITRQSTDTTSGIYNTSIEQE